MKRQEAKSGIRDASPIPSAHSLLSDGHPHLPTFDELGSEDTTGGPKRLLSTGIKQW